MRGKLLGVRYQVVEVLAKGGFGQTYIAQDIHRPGNPQCVVKHLLPNSVNSRFLQNARRLFQTEAEILEKLGNHNQIPRLLAYFEENQEFYLVQEFIPGNTLRAELKPDKRWSESQVYQLLEEVLGILVFVHSNGVIHRDIKPDNLIRRSSDGKLVLVDFGSVKQAWTQVITAQEQTSWVIAGSLPATIAIGTPGYMPTEQGRGRPQPNSDLYALGMIAIQALTGKSPTQLLEESDNGEIVWQHQANVSEALASVLTKMARYNCKNRYQTAAEALKLIKARGRGAEEQRSRGEFLQSPDHPITLSGKATRHSPLTTYHSFNPQPLVPSWVNSQTNSVAAAKSASVRVLTATPVSTTQPNVLVPLEAEAENSSQNIIPESPVNSSANQTNLPPSHTKILVTHNQPSLRIGAAITAMLVSLVAIYTIKWPLTNTEKTLERTTALKAKGNYQECVNQATTSRLGSQANTNAKVLLYECRLAEAKQLAAAKNFPAAIAQASQIPQTDASYAAARQLIAQWSNSILEIAKKHYQSGELNQAIASAQNIPKTSPIYPKVPKAIEQWQKDWKKNNSALQAAKSSLAAGKCQQALSAAKQVTNHPYWQQQVKPIIQAATAKIAKPKNFVDHPLKPAVTKLPARTPAKQVTSAVTKPKISTTPASTKSFVTKKRRNIAKPSIARKPTRTIPKRLPISLTRRSVSNTPRKVSASVTEGSRWITRTRATGSIPQPSIRIVYQRVTRSIAKRSYRRSYKRVTRSSKGKRSH